MAWGGGGEGGRIKPVPGELWGGLSLPRVATEADGATRGLAELGGFPEGTANVQSQRSP